MANRFEKALKGKGADIVNIGKIEEPVIKKPEESNTGNEVIVQDEIVSNKSSKNGKIVIKQKKKEKIKDYKNFFLKISTIEMIDKYSKKTGMNKSELVDTLLEEAFKMLEVK